MTSTTPATTPDPKPHRADGFQSVVLVVIVLGVGIMAGAASFNHVHHFTITNSPEGTADWFGWANAVITELIPIASLIEIARRRRANRATSIRYPVILLVSAMSVSLTAQLAVARPTVFGWLVSALPALAFFALSKLVFTATAHAPSRPTNPVTASAPAASPAPSPDTAPAKASPAATTRKTRATTTTAKKSAPAKKTTPRTPAKKTTAPAAPEPATAAPESGDVTAPAADQRYPDLLLSNARTIAASHRHEHGEDIKPNQLAVRLRVPTDAAANILTHLTKPPPATTTRPHNGTPVSA